MRSHKLQVGLLVVLLAGACVGGYLLLRKPQAGMKPAPPSTVRPDEDPPPTIVVESSYPGAGAQAVADAVAAPIEQQVNGVEGMLHLYSRSADDGRYSLTVSFPPGTNMDIAQVLVQNRVALAEVALPDEVRRLGVTVRKKSPELTMLAALISPDGKYDQVYLGNYAAQRIRDELARVPGVASVDLLGRREPEMRIWPNSARLSAYNLTVDDLITALQPATLVGAPDWPPKVDHPGRSADADMLGRIILKATAEGEIVRLRDVARVELGTAAGGDARLDGKPAVALALHPLPGADRRATLEGVHDKLRELRKAFPDRLELATVFDAADGAPAPILMDVLLPEGVTLEYTMAKLAECEEAVRQQPGVELALTLTEDPFAAGRPRTCLLIRPAAGLSATERAKLIEDAEQRHLREITNVAIHINDLAAPGRSRTGAYPVSFVLLDREGRGRAALTECVGRVMRKLRENPKFADVWTTVRDSTPQLVIDIDRDRAAAKAIKLPDMQKTLRAALGPIRIGSSDLFGRPVPIVLQLDKGLVGHNAEAIENIFLKNARGEFVPLSAVAKLRKQIGPEAVERVDLYPAVEVRANLAPGISLEEARKRCEAAARDESPSVNGVPAFPLAWPSAP